MKIAMAHNDRKLKAAAMASQRSLLSRIAALHEMAVGDLRKAWVEKLGAPVPLVSAAILRLALAYEIQKDELGSLSRDTLRRLDGLASRGKLRVASRPGMRFVREWKGTLHVVTVDESGSIIWQNQKWRSLSEVARAITGTSWSGPAFFGLIEQVEAA